MAHESRDHMDKQTEEVLEMLAVLEPTTADAPRPARQMLAQVNQAAAETGWGFRLRRFFTTPGGRRVAAALAVLLVVAALSLPPVRTAAAEFLSLFRVQNFTAITISPEQIAVLEKVAAQGLVPGELTIDDEPGELRPVDSVDEAAAMAGLSTVRTLNDLGEPESVYVSGGGNGRFIIDLAGSRAILEAVGADPLLLPDAVDGATVEMAVFPGVLQAWPEAMLLQSESPLVEYPQALDTAVLGQAVLRVMGLSEAEAARLAQEIDWTSTLLLPIPQELATYREVTVDGVSGILVTDLDGRAAAIVWQKAGILYMLSAERSPDDLLALAHSLD